MGEAYASALFFFSCFGGYRHSPVLFPLLRFRGEHAVAFTQEGRALVRAQRAPIPREKNARIKASYLVEAGGSFTVCEYTTWVPES